MGIRGRDSAWRRMRRTSGVDTPADTMLGPRDVMVPWCHGAMVPWCHQTVSRRVMTSAVTSAVTSATITHSPPPPQSSPPPSPSPPPPPSPSPSPPSPSPPCRWCWLTTTTPTPTPTTNGQRLATGKNLQKKHEYTNDCAYYARLYGGFYPYERIYRELRQGERRVGV